MHVRVVWLVFGFLWLFLSSSGRCQQGSLDKSFDAGSIVDDIVYAIARQDNGQLIIGGVFRVAGKEARSGIARLNADGSLDTTFGSKQLGVPGYVYALAIQPDGKVLIGGRFFYVDGAVRNNLARLNYDGSLDANFSRTLSGASGTVYAILPLSNGQIMVPALRPSLQHSDLFKILAPSKMSNGQKRLLTANIA
jgi:uncharacterized delta-60 repeat protein